MPSPLLCPTADVPAKGLNVGRHCTEQTGAGPGTGCCWAAQLSQMRCRFGKSSACQYLPLPGISLETSFGKPQPLSFHGAVTCCAVQCGHWHAAGLGTRAGRSLQSQLDGAVQLATTLAEELAKAQHALQLVGQEVTSAQQTESAHVLAHQLQVILSKTVLPSESVMMAAQSQLAKWGLARHSTSGRVLQWATKSP